MFLISSRASIAQLVEQLILISGSGVQVSLGAPLRMIEFELNQLRPSKVLSSLLMIFPVLVFGTSVTN